MGQRITRITRIRRRVGLQEGLSPTRRLIRVIRVIRWPTAQRQRNRAMHVVLIEPEIPPNTGNIARLCAATRTTLHLVGPLGFRLTDSRVRRAGLDYWDHVEIRRHVSVASFLENVSETSLFLFSKHATVSYTEARYQESSYLVFGSETRGLPRDMTEKYSTRLWTIPLFHSAVRSLNLSNAVAIVCYEALRQLGRV